MWKRKSSAELYRHPRLVVEEDEVELPSGEVIQYLRYGYGGDGSVIVAMNEKDEVLFIREYSYVLDRHLLQLPMGKIEEGETPEIAGNRELQEETGYAAETIALKGSYYQNHRRSENKGYVLFATGLQDSKLDGDIEEAGSIETVWVHRSEIRSRIDEGKIIDADSLSSLLISGVMDN